MIQGLDSISSNLEATCDWHFFFFIVQASPLSSTVTMSLKDDVPLVLDYRIGEIGNLK